MPVTREAARRPRGPEGTNRTGRENPAPKRAMRRNRDDRARQAWSLATWLVSNSRAEQWSDRLPELSMLLKGSMPGQSKRRTRSRRRLRPSQRGSFSAFRRAGRQAQGGLQASLYSAWLRHSMAVRIVCLRFCLAGQGHLTGLRSFPSHSWRRYFSIARPVGRRWNANQPAEGPAEMLTAAESAQYGDTVQFLVRFGQEPPGVLDTFLREFFPDRSAHVLFKCPVKPASADAACTDHVVHADRLSIVLPDETQRSGDRLVRHRQDIAALAHYHPLGRDDSWITRQGLAIHQPSEQGLRRPRRAFHDRCRRWKSVRKQTHRRVRRCLPRRLLLAQAPLVRRPRRR